ncbi:MAG: DUF1963 domain-containing protein [bacterium]|nr:DUF1963 domain-containing protein [bacterium]
MSNSKDLEILEELIADNELHDYSRLIKSWLLPALKMETTEADAGDNVGNSRFGGVPDLPSGLEWPRNTDGHLVFLAQINFTEAPGTCSDLPSNGILYVFLGDNESCAEVEVALLYTAENRDARKGTLPADYKVCYEYGDHVGTPHHVKYTPGTTLPESEDPVVIVSGMREEDRDDYYDIASEWPDHDHRLRGHCNCPLGDPRVGLPQLQEGNQWLLLMQLGWDKKAEFCFWDAGSLMIFIDSASLAVRDFSRVKAVIFSS